MKISEALRAAAIVVGKNVRFKNRRYHLIGCCDALSVACVTDSDGYDDYAAARDFIRHLFFLDSDFRKTGGCYWWAATCVEPRRLALLFAALIAEEQGL